MRIWLIVPTLMCATLVTAACSTPAVTPTTPPATPFGVETPSPAPPTATLAPTATSSHTPTFTVTATQTQAPTETATLAPTDTATRTSLPSPTTPLPSATATPVLEPITLGISGPEARQETVEAHQPVIAKWGWVVCNSEVLGENLDALTFQISVDGSVVYTGDLAERRSAVEEEEREGGLHMWGTYWTYAMGAFASGSSHLLEVEWRLSHAVTDGCDADGDGQTDIFGPGAFLVQGLQVAVR
jgi:hypothetical protein